MRLPPPPPRRETAPKVEISIEIVEGTIKWRGTASSADVAKVLSILVPEFRALQEPKL